MATLAPSRAEREQADEQLAFQNDKFVLASLTIAALVVAAVVLLVLVVYPAVA